MRPRELYECNIVKFEHYELSPVTIPMLTNGKISLN